LGTGERQDRLLSDSGLGVSVRSDDGTVAELQEPLLLGGYTAKQCPVRVQNDSLPLELPGIEPALEMVVNCGNVEFNYAKRRQMTCGYAESVDGINSTPQSLSVPKTML
jgi:hypothetical protein